MALSRVVNGRPVGPDVRKLMDTFGTVLRGVEIPYEDIEKLIGASHKEPRFRTVTNSWRRQVHETTGVFIECVPGVGFRGCDAKTQLETGGKSVRSACKKIAVGVALAQTTPEGELSDGDKMKRDHLLTSGSSLIQATRNTVRYVLAPPGKTV